MKSLSRFTIIIALGWRSSALALEPVPSPPPTIALSDLPREAVRVEILERLNVAQRNREGNRRRQR
jgi:DNA-directed RNA polymerase subunit K/omega